MGVEPTTVPEPRVACRPVPQVQLTAVTRVYDLGAVQVPALRGIDLTIDEGDFLAIMGASGSGKSTLMNLIGCLDRPSTGSYHLNGEEIAEKSRRELADLRNRTLGFVFQSFNLLARTSALENVELPLVYAGFSARERRLKAVRALERVGLGDRLAHHTNELSGGQQQRVAVARAIVNEPRLILADEPTGNLDSTTSLEIVALLRELNLTGITLAIVTHEPDIAAYASRVVVVKDGLIAADGRQHARVPLTVESP